MGSGRLNATARGGASFSAPVSRGTMRGAGMEAFFAASALCEGGGRGDDASADRDGWTGRGKDKRQLRWAISNRRGRGGRSGGPRGRRGGTGTHRVRRDVEAEVLHPRDGRPGPEGVTHLLFERRGSGDGARRVSRCRESVAETRDEEIQGRGSARGRAGPTSGGRGGAVRTSSSSSSSGRCGDGTRDGGEVVVSRRASEGGRRAARMESVATRRRAEMSWIRSGRVCAHRLARGPRGLREALLAAFFCRSKGLRMDRRTEEASGDGRRESRARFASPRRMCLRRVATIRETGRRRRAAGERTSAARLMPSTRSGENAKNE